MKTRKKSSLLLLCLFMTATVFLLQSCKEKVNEDPVKNVISWTGTYEEEDNYGISVTVETGDKENAKWVSFYQIGFEKDTETGFYQIVKSDDKEFGIKRFDNGKAVISIVSANSELMPHYFENGSEIVIKRDATDETKMSLFYLIVANDGGVFSGEVELTAN